LRSCSSWIVILILVWAWPVLRLPFGTQSPGGVAFAASQQSSSKKSSSGKKVSGNNKQLLTDAKSLYESGRYYGALTKLEKILETDKEIGEVYLYLGHCYLKTRKASEAAKAYEQYLEFDPEAVDAEKYRALITVLQGQSGKVTSTNLNRGSAYSGGSATSTGNWGSGRSSPGGSNAPSSGTTGSDYMKEATITGLFRWPESRMPITVFIEPGDSVPGYRAEFDDVLQHAFREWTTATEGKVKFDIVTKRDGAEMIVSWTNDMHAPELKAEAGKASVLQDSEGIKSAEIKLLTVSPDQQGPIGCELLYNVCLHEIGHALGLMGHSPYPDDIMYPQLSVQTGITARDARTLHVVYAAAAEALSSGASDSNSNGDASESEFSRLTPKIQSDLLLKAGTRAVFAGNYKESIEKLEAALKINPDIELARSNLAVAANNLALQTADKDERLILLHKALFWNPNSDAGRTNLEQLVDDFDVVVNDSASRIKFADKLEKNRDYLGACVELSEAARIKPDSAVTARAEALRQKVLGAEH
jgi:tetratricopeptide (TPR) repeat protein